MARTVRNQKQEEKERPLMESSVFDTFTNTLARLGPIGSNNFMSSTNYPIQRLTRNYNLLNSLFRNQWICKKIIETIPSDMLKNWFTITAELTPEQQDRYNTLEQNTRIKEKIREGLLWGRLYGGAACVIMIAGHEDKLDQPLEVNDILPNTFKGLLVLDRWSGIYPSIEIIEDIEDPDFGQPEYYSVRDLTTETMMEKVHHSRVIRFLGRILPYWEELAEMHWGASEIEHVFDEMTKRDNTSWNIAGLVFQANLLVNKVNGLDQLTALGDPQMMQDFYNLKSAQNQMRSNNSMMVIGDKDSMETMPYTFSGLNEISESQMCDISGASEIPVTRLFGRAPGGLNATGESDMQNYYDMVAQLQVSAVTPKIDKLLPIMFMSEFGMVPKDLGHRWNPIKTPSDEQMANLVKNKTDSIVMAYKEGLLTQRAAVTELHALSQTTNMFSAISDENIEAASDTYDNMGDISGMGPGMDSVFDDKWVTTTPEKGKGRHILIDDDGKIIGGAIPKEAIGKNIREWGKEEAAKKQQRKESIPSQSKGHSKTINPLTIQKTTAIISKKRNEGLAKTISCKISVNHQELTDEKLLGLAGSFNEISKKFTVAAFSDNGGEMVIESGGEATDKIDNLTVTVREKEIYIDYFIVKKQNRGKNMAAKLIATMCENAEGTNIDKITLHAAGYNGAALNGYYSWPRLGFDQELDEGVVESVKKRSIERRVSSKEDWEPGGRFHNVTHVSQFMDTEQGRNMWKQFGSELTHATFDLDADSTSTAVFYEYLKEKGLMKK